MTGFRGKGMRVVRRAETVRLCGADETTMQTDRAERQRFWPSVPKFTELVPA
jgi:hypothetical protein